MPALVVALAGLPMLEKICDLRCSSAAPGVATETRETAPHCPAHAARGNRPAPPERHPDQCGHDHEMEGALLASASGGKIGPAGSATATALGLSASPCAVLTVCSTARDLTRHPDSPPPRFTSSVLRL